MKHYYYSENDQQLGPFTFDELKTKRIKKSTLVWTDGMPEWTIAESVNELKEILIAVPPPLPNKKSIKSKEQSQNTEPVYSDSDAKYDLTYKKETDATTVGIFLILINLGYIIYYNYLKAQIHDASSYDEYAISPHTDEIVLLISAVLRIGVSIWITQIAKRQNRNQTQWGILGFLFPTITLIVIGQKRKLKFQIKPDQSLTKIEQYNKLKEQAAYFFDEKREGEEKQIYKYIYENYQATNADIFRLAELFFLTKEYREAEKQFAQIKDDDKFSDVSNYYLGFIAIKNNDLQNARTFLSIASKQGEPDSQFLLNTISQSEIESASIIKLKNKYGHENSILSLDELEVIDGLEIFDLKISKRIKCSIQLYWNGIGLTFWESTWKRKEQNIFISLYLLKSIELIEGYKLKIQLTDNRQISFSTTSFSNSNTSSALMEQFETEYKIAVDDFLN